MARNLATSRCPECSYHVRLSDVRGKPLEIRRTGACAPHFGVRFDCSCGEVYFVILRRSDAFWSEEHLSSGAWEKPNMWFGVPNRHQGKFAFKDESGVAHNTGTFTLDLSYYGSFNDEPNDWRGGEKPARLCEDNAEDAEWAW